MRNNPPDLQSVAKHSGVSISTVSRALTRPDRVATITRERVLEAVTALGYAPNQLARSLRMQGSRTIGLIISDILVPFHSEVAKGVEDFASSHNYTTILCNSSEDSKKEKQYRPKLAWHPLKPWLEPVRPWSKLTASVEQKVCGRCCQTMLPAQNKPRSIYLV
jgi:hypothetical protein